MSNLAPAMATSNTSSNAASGLGLSASRGDSDFVEAEGVAGVGAEDEDGAVVERGGRRNPVDDVVGDGNGGGDDAENADVEMEDV